MSLSVEPVRLAETGMSAPRPNNLSRLDRVSIIVPVATGDIAWKELLRDLATIPLNAQILVAATMPEPHEFREILETFRLHGSCRWLWTKPGRARQMNRAAALAERDYLWFLHADSRVSPAALAALDASLESQPLAIHYFDLAFLGDGPRWMTLNTWGVWFRSHWFGLPFGDQGLCLSAHLFNALGGYDEQVRYGEDHLLIWAARRHGIRLRCAGPRLRTSARRYADQGWTRTTLRHLVRTAKQAAPQFVRLLTARALRCINPRRRSRHL